MASSTKNFKVNHGSAFLRFSVSFTETEENHLESIKEALRERGVPENSELFWIDSEQSRVYLRNCLEWKDCVQANTGELIRLVVVPKRDENCGFRYRNSNNNEGAIVEEPMSPRSQAAIAEGFRFFRTPSRSRSPERRRRSRPYRVIPERDARSRSRSVERVNGSARITRCSVLNPVPYSYQAGSSCYRRPAGNGQPYRYC